jgi:hypothetical protein
MHEITHRRESIADGEFNRKLVPPSTFVKQFFPAKKSDTLGLKI